MRILFVFIAHQLKHDISIKLSARDTYWNKYAYQFAHEFCHVISKHDNLKENPNNWFHEAICELSIHAFTLRLYGGKLAHRSTVSQLG